MQNKELYIVQITRAGKKLIEFKTPWTAIVGMGNATTLCLSDDPSLRLVLASRVQLYLNSLIETIETDTAGQLSKSEIEDLISSLIEVTEVKAQMKDPTTAQEIINRLKRG